MEVIRIMLYSNSQKTLYMSHRIRLLLLIPHLGGGGAEQVTAQLAMHLDPRRFDLHLATVTADHAGVPPLPTSLTVHHLDRSRVRHASRQILNLVHTLQPDLLFSGMAHLSFLILALKPLLPRHTRILVRQNTTASAVATTRFHRLRYRLLYPKADMILCQSQAMADDLSHRFSIARDKISIHANPINVGSIRAATQLLRKRYPSQSLSEPRLLCVARLAHEKGIDLLLQCFVNVLRACPGATLTILGNGPLQAQLQHLSRCLGIDHAVSFPGFSSDLTHHYARSTLFVLPSRYEGMPNALLEAAAAQLPIVTTPASQGLIDLVNGQPGVWLTPGIDPESIAETILLALGELQRSARNTNLFDHPFLAPFETCQSIASYSACFERVVQQARG